MSTPDTNTDDSKLVTTDTVYVSPDGCTTDEAFPKPNVEYDFCVDIANAGELPSGSFFVRFNLSGDQHPPRRSLTTGCGIAHGLVYIVFPGSAQGWPLSQPEIDQYGAQLFAKWGGVDKAKECFPNLEWSS